MLAWSQKTFWVRRQWDGAVLPASERARVSARWDELGRVDLTWDAPWPVGPEPRQFPGCCANLWEFSAVELFLASNEGPYLELEFGPAGHWLAIYLRAYRQRSEYLVDVDYRWWRWGDRWRGRALVTSHKSHRWVRGNAFLISRHDSNRRYAAAAGVPGSRPDFHRHDCYLPL